MPLSLGEREPRRHEPTVRKRLVPHYAVAVKCVETQPYRCFPLSAQTSVSFSILISLRFGFGEIRGGGSV
jgi:hypothetical protein